MSTDWMHHLCTERRLQGPVERSHQLVLFWFLDLDSWLDLVNVVCGTTRARCAVVCMKLKGHAVCSWRGCSIIRHVNHHSGHFKFMFSASPLRSLFADDRQSWFRDLLQSVWEPTHLPCGLRKRLHGHVSLDGAPVHFTSPATYLRAVCPTPMEATALDLAPTKSLFEACGTPRPCAARRRPRSESTPSATNLIHW